MKNIFVWCLLLVSALVVPVAAEENASSSADSVFSRVDMNKGLSRHKDMFILFGSYADEYHGKQTEVVFQISAKQSLGLDGLYFAYTQKSFWQAFDTKNSSPFRETNFNPEMFYRIEPGRFPRLPEKMGLDLGGEHESNGQKAPVSRSWNKLYAAPFFQFKHTLVYTKLWYRVPEEDKPYEGAAEGDDNPDIHRYLGYGELHVYQNLFGDHSIHAMGRATSHNRGAFALNYNATIPKLHCSFIVHFFTGYGESLIDYDNSVTRVGAGLSFTR